MRRGGGKRKFSAGVYAGHTGSCASLCWARSCGKLAAIAGFLLFCAVVFAGMGVLGIAFVLIDVDFRSFFWLFVPLSVLFALIGAPLGAAGVVYARSAWASQEAIRGGVDRMEDTWRENQEYALRQTRICFVVMWLFRWLLGTFDDCMRRDGDMVAAARRDARPGGSGHGSLRARLCGCW